MILVLGGGWVGARFCLQNPSTTVTTSRSKNNLLQLQSLGLELEAVVFDLDREDTWTNLPPRESVTATIITFALSVSQFPSLEKLLAGHIPVDKQILCLGTTSAFQVGDHKSIINESTPLTGTSFTGASLADRVDGENRMLSRGAAILHLSGIVGDEKEDIAYRGSRSVRSFYEKANPRNGLKLINLIHVEDICKILAFFSNWDRFESIKGERMNKLTVFVGNLQRNIKEKVLDDLFKQCGEIREVRIPRNSAGRPRGCAYVEYTDESSALQAVEKLDSHLIGLKRISVALSNPPAKKPADDATSQGSGKEGVAEGGVSGVDVIRNTKGVFAKPSFIPRRAKPQADEEDLPMERRSRTNISLLPRVLSHKGGASVSKSEGGGGGKMSNDDFKNLFAATKK